MGIRGKVGRQYPLHEPCHRIAAKPACCDHHRERKLAEAARELRSTQIIPSSEHEKTQQHRHHRRVTEKIDKIEDRSKYGRTDDGNVFIRCLAAYVGECGGANQYDEYGDKVRRINPYAPEVGQADQHHEKYERRRWANRTTQRPVENRQCAKHEESIYEPNRLETEALEQRPHVDAVAVPIARI